MKDKFGLRTGKFAALLCSLSVATSVVAVDRDFFGICDQLTRDNFGLGWDARELESNIRAAESAGVRHLRTDFYWDLIEPTQGNWNWAPFDKVINVAAEHGITILPIVSHQNAAYGNPIVTNPVGGEDWHNLVTWSNFVSQVMARYRGRIEAVEIWNEQNIEQFWQSPNVENYCKLLKASYVAVKAVDPNILVVMGGLAGRQDGYFKTLCTDAKDWFDVVAFHPYKTNREPEWKQNAWDEFWGKDLCPGSNGMVDEYLRVMSDNGVTQPVWITEIGWPTHPDGVSEADQAAYHIRFIEHCLTKSNISRVYIYECRAAEWADGERPEPVSEANFGILHKNYQPKPAYDAVRNYIISNTSFQDPSDGRLYLVIGDDLTDFSSFQSTHNWLGTGAAEADKHYLVDLGDTKCIRTEDWWMGNQAFGGASLTLGRVGGPSARFVNRGWGDTFTCTDLRLANGRLLAEGKWGFANQVWNGHATILSPAEAPFLIQSAAGEIRHHEWNMSLSGAAGTAIRFAGTDAGLVVTLKGDASDYYGKYIVDLDHTRLELTAAALAGTGSPLADGILIRNNAEITPLTAGLELTSQRRGVTVESTGGRLLVDKDCTFSLPLEGTLTKTGDATLVFGTSSGSGRLDVTSGTVEVKPEAAGRIGRITGGTIRAWSEDGDYGNIALSGATIAGGTFVLDCDETSGASDSIAIDSTCSVTWPINITLSGAKLSADRTYPLVRVAKELKAVTASDFNVTADTSDGYGMRIAVVEEDGVSKLAVRVCSDTSFGDVYVWQGASGGDWNTASNWKGGVVPNANNADVDLSAAVGSVVVGSAVTVGRIAFKPSGASSVTVSGAKITFAAAGTPQVDVGAGSTFVLQNDLGGSQGLEKWGAGTFNPNALTAGNCFSGKYVVCEGTSAPAKVSGDGMLGGTMEVRTGATFRMTDHDMYAWNWNAVMNGGTFDKSSRQDYIGSLSFANGGQLVNANGGGTFVLLEGSTTGLITATGDGDAGTFDDKLAVTARWSGNTKTSGFRTQKVDVQNEGATFRMKGKILDNRMQVYDDDFRPEEVADYPYAGQLQKTGKGDLVLDNETVSLTGPTTVEDGRLVLTNTVKMTASTIRLKNNASQLAFGKDAVAKVSGIDCEAGGSIDLNGVSLDLGGTGADAAFSGTFANGTVRKVGPNAQVLKGGQTQTGWDVLGGTLSFGLKSKPVVRYGFDGAVIGADSGSLGKTLVADGAVAQVDDPERGRCVSLSNGGCLQSADASGLPCTSSFSVSLWIKPTDASGALVSWGEDQYASCWGGNNFAILYGNHELKTQFWIGGDDFSVSTPKPLVDGWHHVAFTFDSASKTQTFYLDGAFVGSKVTASVGPSLDASRPFKIGRGTAWGYFYSYSGLVDDVRVYSGVLGAADVETLSRVGTSDPGSAFAAGGTVRVERDATLAISDLNQTFGTLGGKGTLALDVAEATVSVAAGQNSEIGRVSGSGTLKKTGPGTLTLSAAANLSGTVDLAEGEVVADGPAVSDDLRSHLKAHWDFNDPSDVYRDASGNGLDLQNSPAASWNWRNRLTVVGGALYMDAGDNHHLVLKDASKVSALPCQNSSFTIALWINPDADCAWNGAFIGWGNGNYLNYTGFRFNGNYLHHYNWGADNTSSELPTYWFTDGDVPTGWHHAAVTYDSATGTKKLYADGQCVFSGQIGSLNVVAADFALGYATGSSPFKGYMDDVMVFDTAVSETQIKELLHGFAASAVGSATVKTAAGTGLRVRTGTVALGSVSGQGTVTVDENAVLAVTGDCEMDGPLAGSGSVAVLGGGRLALTGGQDFSGAVGVDAGSELVLVTGANAQVDALSLGEGVRLEAILTAETSLPALTVAGAVALPENATFRVVVPAEVKAGSWTLLRSDDSLTGSVGKWTLDVALPRSSQRAELVVRGNALVLNVTKPGCVLIVK